MRNLIAAVFVLAVALIPLASKSLAQDVDTESAASPAGSALMSIFSPAKAPQRKTMGLLQRSFLDMAGQGDAKLEVAIVVDGTDSMATELAGVRQSIHQMLDDLRRYRNNDVLAALVIYRDAGSPSGEFEIPLAQFTADEQAIETAVKRLVPESGAPFFHELPDLGLYQAIETLPWSADDQVAKWILMFGDAPPYAAAFEDPDNKAYRRYATPLLVGLAQKKNIRINSILCTSSDSVGDSYDRSIAETRGFFNALAGGTDGLMLDLSYPEIRSALLEAGKTPEIGLAKIAPIEAIDLEAVRRDRAGDGTLQPVSVAVLPHMPIDQMTFNASLEAVQVSTAIRHQLGKVAGVKIASPRDIKDQLRRLRAEGLKPDQAIRGLAARLGVDFVVWGSLESGTDQVQTAAYRRGKTQPVVPIKLAKNSSDVAMVLINAAAKNAPDDVAIAQLVSRMETMRTAVTAPLASDSVTNRELLTTLESLEQALAFESGSEDSFELLQQAEKKCSQALASSPRNAIAHWLMSNIAYNQASRLFKADRREQAEAKMNDVRNALTRAVELRDSIATPSLVTEIEADYYLLVKRDAGKAIERYQSMTADDQPVKSQLRGHWMLSGIHAGDWGTGNGASGENGVVDPQKSRQHLVEILANFSDSPEAALLRQWLQWDESTEQTKFNYLPKVNTGFVGA